MGHLSFKIPPMKNKFIQQELELPCACWIKLSTHISSTSSPIKRIFDPKSISYIYVLDTPKNPRSIDQTEGILSSLSQELEREGIEPIDLIKRAWKTNQNVLPT